MADVSVGSKAPSSRFTTPTGEKRTLADVLAASDGRPTLLVFFKVTCPVCQLDWPYLEKLHRAHGDSLRVVGVSQNDAEDTRRFYAQYGKASFDLLLDPEPAFAASDAFGVESVPHHVLIAPDGIVQKVYSGWSRREVEELDRRMAAVLGKKPAGVVAADDPVAVFKPG